MTEDTLPPWLSYDPDTIDPRVQERIELGPDAEWDEVRGRGRVRRRSRGRAWKALIIATAAWVAVYIPFIATWIITGSRPLDPILRLIPAAWLWAIFLLHTLSVGGVWGFLFWRAAEERRRRRERLRNARTREALLRLTPSEFEEWTGELFRRRGYRVINTQDTADHGIDLIVLRDGERGIVQCKRYRGTVGEPVVRDLYGVIIHERADRGYLVTTGGISRQAHRWARGKPLELIDGDKLVRLASD